MINGIIILYPIMEVSNNILCKGGCKKTLPVSDYGKKKDGELYKQCLECREKKKKINKRDMDEGISLSEDSFLNTNNNNTMNERKKRETRPSISDEKKQMILKEQDNFCRGPGKGECPYYECDMKINKKRFSDQKAVLPQYDHITRWKEGGNSIKNIQALCPNCHWMKTRMESMINEDQGSIESQRIKSIYGSLTIQKYMDSSDSDSDSDDEFFNAGRTRRNIKYYSTFT
tara:strand:- start:1588 stop:2277 length:690 start_codon:yes stop_codon:yes gene_type:complete